MEMMESESEGAGAWRGRVASAADLVACVGALGVVPVEAAPPWPSLATVLAPGVTWMAAWTWVGEAVAQREIYAGRAVPGWTAGTLAALPVFVWAFARTPGSDPMLSYAQGLYSITAKAVVELILARGPLTVQQIRLGLGQHKRFLIQSTPTVLAELERAMIVVGAAPELAAAWRPARGPARPRSRFNPPPTPGIDLRVWEVTMRWAPPAALAAADRLREQPGQAYTLLKDHLRQLNPLARDEDLDLLLQTDGTHEPPTDDY
jgi:hypothetical protein